MGLQLRPPRVLGAPACGEVSTVLEHMALQCGAPGPSGGSGALGAGVGSSRGERGGWGAGCYLI